MAVQPPSALTRGPVIAGVEVMVKSVVLDRHPSGPVQPTDFRLIEHETPELKEGGFITRNRVFSLDAGFRQWMSAGAGDNYLPGMPLNQPVQSIVLGEVIQSTHRDYPVGTFVSARAAWEEFSALDGSDLCSPLEVAADLPITEYMSTLGPTGITAWIGLIDIAQARAGDVVVISAAGGAVGTVAAQLAGELGCTSVGLTSTEAKARWLVDAVGYDHAISRDRQPDLSNALTQTVPQGVDVFFDNVGGATLDAVMGHLNERARIALCGAIAQYESRVEPLTNTWQMITKRARMEGYMFSDYADDFPRITQALESRLRAGTLQTFAQVYEGIDRTPQAFCDMMSGRSRGKCLVVLE